jgi:hypothetical protein
MSPGLPVEPALTRPSVRTQGEVLIVRITSASFNPTQGSKLDEPLVVEEQFADGGEGGESAIFQEGTEVLQVIEEDLDESVVTRYSFRLDNGEVYNVVVERMKPGTGYIYPTRVSLYKSDTMWNLIEAELDGLDEDEDGLYKIEGGHNVGIYIAPTTRELVFYMGAHEYGERCALEEEYAFLRALYRNGRAQGRGMVENFEAIGGLPEDLDELREYEFTIDDLTFEDMGILPDFEWSFENEDLRRVFKRGRDTFNSGLLDGAYNALQEIIEAREELLGEDEGDGEEEEDDEDEENEEY